MVVESPNVIDIEASGFGKYSYPIEIGLITSDGRRFCRLIKPLKNWTHWDETAAKLHGIEKSDLLQYGTEAKRVCLQLNAFLQNTTVYSDGWTVDDTWIRKLFNETGVSMSFKLSPLELILKESQMNIWNRVKQVMMSRRNDNRHRASNDAKIVQETYLKTNEIIKLGANQTRQCDVSEWMQPFV
jgi:hypothetical protein